MAQRVRNAFAEAYAAAPVGVWSAPGRVNLAGEHVDYNRGLCLPFALAQRTYVAMQPRGDSVVRVRSAQEPRTWEGSLDGLEPPIVPRWAAYVAGVPWALRDAGYDVPGIDVAVDSLVPRGAGLSSSAALECAIAVGLDELAGLGLAGNDQGRQVLAAACVRAENDIAGAPTGGLDQATALRAQQGHALLLDCADFSLRQVPLDLDAEGMVVLVIDTRTRHALADGRYGERRSACDRACAALGVTSLRALGPDDLEEALERLPAGRLRRRVHHVVTEIERVRAAAALLDAGRLDRLGPLMDASHASLRDDYEVSCTELDLACETAVGAGALGARMTGAGFGGSAIALVRDRDVRAVADAVSAAFTGAALAEPAYLQAWPSGPAGRTA
jgi:galactokinase